MVEWEDPFAFPLKIYKSDIFNPTKVSLLNTTTCLSDPCINQYIRKWEVLEHIEKVGQEKERDSVCRCNLTATTTPANSASGAEMQPPTYSLAEGKKGRSSINAQESSSSSPWQNRIATAEMCLQTPSYSTTVWQPLGTRRQCCRLTNLVLPICHVPPPWWWCPETKGNPPLYSPRS